MDEIDRMLSTLDDAGRREAWRRLYRRGYGDPNEPSAAELEAALTYALRHTHVKWEEDQLTAGSNGLGELFIIRLEMGMGRHCALMPFIRLAERLTSEERAASEAATVERGEHYRRVNSGHPAMIAHKTREARIWSGDVPVDELRNSRDGWRKWWSDKPAYYARELHILEQRERAA